MELRINTKRFICFDNDGNIIKIIKKPDENFNNLEVELDDIKDLLDGKLSLISHKVEYDFLEKRYILKNTKQQNEDQMLASFLYEIPTSIENEKQITIVKDNVNYEWKLKVDEDFAKKLVEDNIQINPTNHYYSITKKGDPNILYRLIKFDNNMTVPFKYDFELDDLDISVYTTRKFHTYLYEVINE